jgi:hypothetical protein
MSALTFINRFEYEMNDGNTFETCIFADSKYRWLVQIRYNEVAPSPTSTHSISLYKYCTDNNSLEVLDYFKPMAHIEVPVYWDLSVHQNGFIQFADHGTRTHFYSTCLINDVDITAMLERYGQIPEF